MVKNNRIPKMISWIVATISLIAALWLFLSPFWFWVSFEIAAALLVATGCGGEWWLHHHPAGRKKQEKDEHHKLESRFIAMVVFGVAMELFSLGHSIREGVKLDKQVEELKEDNLGLQTNVFSLQKSMIELAHSYDLSTNALAEANMRILSVSNAVAINSPGNFPISSVEGTGYLNFPTEYSWVAKYFKSQSFGLWLMNRDGSFHGGVGGIFMICHNRDFGNVRGDTSMEINFKFSDLRTSGASQDVTFNNFAVAKLDLWTNGDARSDSIIVTGYGQLFLRINSQFDAEVVFPEQTNHMGNILGFVRKQ